ncbi:YncE family protein [Pseudomonas asplenii]|uniref:YncE family protein n=1 Tax=Pseudomonas asplenii TaxID=53407 RepID=UPI0037C7087F
MNQRLDPLLPADNASQVRTFDLTQPEHFTPVPFDELPLYIPGMTTPVVGFDGGINRPALDTHKDKGLLCILLPYEPMAENDFIELFCRDLTTPVAFHTVSDTEAANGSQIPLYIPRARLPDGTADPVFFRLTRVGGNPSETGRFRLKVDTVAPAGRNPVASTYQNENLPLPIFPQELIDFGVGEGDIGNPVPVQVDFYPAISNPAPDINRTVRDRIRLSIGGYIIEHKVTEGEVEGQEPITLWINTGDWAKIGSGEHVCEYEVVDEVGNYSDGWSPAQQLEVRLDDQAEPLLYEPYVRESDEHNVLDADALNGANATLVVAVHRADFTLGDIIRFRLNGRTSQGLPVVRYIDHPVAANELGRTAEVPWNNAEILPLIKGRVQISYVRIRASAPDRGSRSVIVYVIGTQTGTGLPPPWVDEAPDNVLPPDVPFLIVNIKEYVGQDPSDRVTLVLDGTFANGQPYYREIDDMAGTGDIVFHLQNGANGDIARLEGGTLRLYYFVENDMGKRPSEDLLLDVGEPQASLPPVEVEQAPPPNQVFDPEVSLFDARVVIKANIDIIENDIINLYAMGSVAGGSAPPINFRVTTTWVGRDLPFTLRRQYILPNLDRSMRLYYTLARAGERVRFSHPFVMSVGSALDLPVPHVLESTLTGPDSATINPLHVDNPPVVTIRVQYSPMYTSDNITVSWTGKPGIGTPAITPKPGLASGQVDFLAPSSAVAAAIGAGCRVSYSVERGGATTPSKILHVSVASFNDSDLPTPVIPQANADILDLAHFSGDAHVTVAKWPLSAAGQRVWLECAGTDAEGLPYIIPLLNHHVLTASEATEGLESSLPRAELLHLEENSELVVTLRVTFDQTTELNNAVAFPQRRVSVKFSAQNDGTLEFIHGPETVARSGLCKRIVVHLTSNGTTPAPNAQVFITLPNGFKYPDGGTGERGFTTDQDGNITLIGVTAPNTLGKSMFTALKYPLYESSEVTVVVPGTIATIPVGRGPSDLAISEVGYLAYVINATDNTLVTIDTDTNKIIHTLSGFRRPTRLKLNATGTYAYILNSSDNSVSEVDLKSQRITKTLSGFVNPVDLAVSLDGRHLYISDTLSNRVLFVDIATSIITPIADTQIQSPAKIIATRDGKTVLVQCTVNGQKTTIYINTVTNTVTRSKQFYDDIFVDLSSSTLYSWEKGTAPPFIYSFDLLTTALTGSTTATTYSLECMSENSQKNMLYASLKIYSSLIYTTKRLGTHGAITTSTVTTEIAVTRDGSRVYGISPSTDSILVNAVP